MRLLIITAFRIADLLTDETTRFLFFILASRSEEDRLPGFIFLPNFFRTLPLLPKNEKSSTVYVVCLSSEIFVMVHAQES